MDNLTRKDQRDRSKINMHEDFEVKYWTHALGISREKLQQIVDKVGNSAAAVRKEFLPRSVSLVIAEEICAISALLL